MRHENQFNPQKESWTFGAYTGTDIELNYLARVFWLVRKYAPALDLE
jgi:hypothetical protein